MSRLPGSISNAEYIKLSNLFAVYVLGTSEYGLSGQTRIEDEMKHISNTISQRDFVSKFTQVFDSAADGIKGFTLYPCNISTGGLADVIINTIPVNREGTTEPLKLRYASDTVDNEVGFTLTVTDTAKNFMDYEPYTTYKIYIPFVGIIDLQSFKIYGKTLHLNYAIDLHTGGAGITLDNGSETLYSGAAQLGVTVPFGFTNEGAKETARFLGAIKSGLALGSMGASGLGTITNSSSKVSNIRGTFFSETTQIASASGSETVQHQYAYNPEGQPIEGAQQTKTMSQQIKSRGASPEVMTTLNSIVSMLPDRASAQIDGGGDFSIFSQPMTPYLIKITPHIHDVDNYGRYFGYACAKEIVLNEHHGFCKISNIHMEGLPDMMEEESTAIESALKAGVILP